MTDKERIEKDAINYVIHETGYQVLPEHDAWKKAYIAGAKSERNKVLDEAIGKIEYRVTSGDWPMHWTTIKEILESLKL